MTEVAVSNVLQTILPNVVQMVDIVVTRKPSMSRYLELLVTQKPLSSLSPNLEIEAMFSYKTRCLTGTLELSRCAHHLSPLFQPPSTAFIENFTEL